MGLIIAIIAMIITIIIISVHQPRHPISSLRFLSFYQFDFLLPLVTLVSSLLVSYLSVCSQQLADQFTDFTSSSTAPCLVHPESFRNPFSPSSLYVLRYSQFSAMGEDNVPFISEVNSPNDDGSPNQG